MEPEETLADQVEYGAVKILRGLPRLYKWRNPAISKLKPAFSDLKLIRGRHLEKALLQDYANKTVPAGSSILLFTWVMEDGWGDYYTQLDAAEILQNAFPTSEIALITLIHHERASPEEEHKFKQYILTYKGNSRKEIIYEALSGELVSLLKKASLLLQLPTYFPHTDEILALAGHDLPHLLVGECGFIDTRWFHPKSGAHCMGLHFLEKGILVKRIPERPIEPCFNVDYTKTERGSYLFLHILLKVLEHDKRDITIAVSKISLYIERMESLIKPLLARLGIGTIEIHFYKTVCPIEINKKGKRLIIRYFDHLPHSSFLEMVASSDQLIGCTGDSSLMEAISSGKPFFYDPPRHKRNLLKDLIALAEDRLGEYPETVEFLKLSLKNPHLALEHVIDGWVTEEFLLLEKEITSSEDTRDETIAEKMGELLQSPKLAQGFSLLSKIIRKEYSFNETLCHLVVRTLD